MAKQSKQLIKRKGGPIPNAIKSPIMDELKKIVESGNILGVTHQQLADRFGKEHNINIKVHTIGNYLKDVYSQIPVEDIQHTQVKIEVMFNKIFRIVQEMIMKAQTPRDKKEAIDLLLRAMDRFTAFLESFGIKQKVADKLEVEQRSVNLNINIDSDSVNLIKELEMRRK